MKRLLIAVCTFISLSQPLLAQSFFGTSAGKKISDFISQERLRSIAWQRNKAENKQLDALKNALLHDPTYQVDLMQRLEANRPPAPARAAQIVNIATTLVTNGILLGGHLTNSASNPGIMVAAGTSALTLVLNLASNQASQRQAQREIVKQFAEKNKINPAVYLSSQKSGSQPPPLALQPQPSLSFAPSY